MSAKVLCVKKKKTLQHDFSYFAKHRVHLMIQVPCDSASPWVLSVAFFRGYSGNYWKTLISLLHNRHAGESHLSVVWIALQADNTNSPAHCFFSHCKLTVLRDLGTTVNHEGTLVKTFLQDTEVEWYLHKRGLVFRVTKVHFRERQTENESERKERKTDNRRAQRRRGGQNLIKKAKKIYKV